MKGTCIGVGKMSQHIEKHFPTLFFRIFLFSVRFVYLGKNLNRCPVFRLDGPDIPAGPDIFSSPTAMYRHYLVGIIVGIGREDEIPQVLKGALRYATFVGTFRFAIHQSPELIGYYSFPFRHVNSSGLRMLWLVVRLQVPFLSPDSTHTNPSSHQNLQSLHIRSTHSWPLCP